MIFQLILGAVSILFLIGINPIYGESFDAIKTIEESIVSVNGKTLELTNMDERQFRNSSIVKVQAEATSGELVLIFFNINNPDFTKVMVYDGQFKKDKIIKNSTNIQEQNTKVEENSILEYTAKLNFDHFISKPTLVGEDFTIKIKTYDENKVYKGMSSNVNILSDVKIKVELAQEKTEFIVVNERTSYEQVIKDDWETITILEGTTDKIGRLIGAEYLASGTFEPNRWMQVTITATLDDQIAERTERVFLTEHTWSRVNPPTP